MFFTQDDFKKIEQYLRLNVLKDTDFQDFEGNINGKDIIAFVHEGKNYKMSLQKLASVIGGNSGEAINDGAFINVSYEDTDNNSLFQLTQYKSLAEAIDNTPIKYRIPGGVIAWLSEKNVWQLHQFTGQSVDEWENITLWKNFNDTSQSGITFTSTVEQIKEGETLETTLECTTLDGGIASSIRIYKDDTLIKHDENVSQLTASVSIKDKSIFKTVVEQYSYTYEKEITISLIQEAWIGVGTSYSEVITDGNKISTDGNIEGNYSLTFASTQRLYLVVPSNITLQPITLNGFEVPMQMSYVTIDKRGYNVYQSSYQYLAGNYIFTIGTYKGNGNDIIQSVQQNMGTLEMLISEQQDLNQVQQKDITTLQSEVEELQGNINIVADEEDITVSNSQYKLANKTYDSQNFSGMGRVFLRKNIVTVSKVLGNNTTLSERVNLLTQSMFKKENTVYIIQYDYKINGETINIPSGSVLLFLGGKISGTVLGESTNAKITGTNVSVANLTSHKSVFDNVTLEGETWRYLQTYSIGSSFPDTQSVPTGHMHIFYDGSVYKPYWQVDINWVDATGEFYVSNEKPHPVIFEDDDIVW